MQTKYKLNRRLFIDLNNMFRLLLKLTTAVFGLSILLILFGQQTAPAQTPGSLDSSFGSGGIVTTSINILDEGRAVAIQADGKIVTAGITYSGTINYDADFALVRYKLTARSTLHLTATAK